MVKLQIVSDVCLKVMMIHYSLKVQTPNANKQICEVPDDTGAWSRVLHQAPLEGCRMEIP